MSPSFQKFAGVSGILAGAAGLIYLGLFISLKNPAARLPSLSLLAVGLFASAVIVALYQIVRDVDGSFALLGLLLGVGGTGGAAVHAAFDLANNLHPPAAPFGYANPVDPRGFLTFAVTGLAAIILSALIIRSGVLPRSAGYLGLLSGVLLVLLYAAYLTILNALNPIVLLLVLTSGVVQPLWYLWIGRLLLQNEAYAPASMGAAQRR
jgi:hypothetical protein